MKRMALLALLAMPALADDAPKVSTLDGTWLWHFTMPDGTEVHPKLKLKQDGTNLTGSSSVRSGSETAITNGVVNGEDLQLEVIRDRGEARVITRYSGKRDGDVIHGKVESNWNGEFQSYPWEAHRAAGIDGTWKWFNFFGERRFESKLTLKLDGDKLTGHLAGRDGRSTEIKDASFKDGEVSFEADRGRDDFKFTQKFKGKLEGDTIKGTIDSTFGGNPRTVDWDAHRAD